MSKSPPRAFKDDAARARYMTAYDAVLARWPVPYDDLMVPTDLGPTHVISSGPKGAPPLVLLHAALATAWPMAVSCSPRLAPAVGVGMICGVLSAATAPISSLRSLKLP